MVGLSVAPVSAVAGLRANRPMAEGPPAGFTGGFGEASCLFCHTGNDANAFGGEVRIEGLPHAYEPGKEYLLTVVLRADETSTAGFQMSARFAEGPNRGADAGVLAPMDARTARTDSAGVAYLHQSPEGSRAPDPSGSSWTVAWSAPGSSRPVALHVAANSGNGDESPLGDLVYTTERIVPGHDR
ncbi:MAG: choice-of-anchor V domain-containing protein [Longimicrobiales bacterium]|nr:choice-of-anchor V domain-containing protein [Longimicrobiales bacterium]